MARMTKNLPRKRNDFIREKYLPRADLGNRFIAGVGQLLRRNQILATSLVLAQLFRWRFGQTRDSLLLKAAQLDHGGDMKPGHISMGVIIGEHDDIRPLGINGGVVRGGNGVFAAVTRSDRERQEWRAVQ